MNSNFKSLLVDGNALMYKAFYASSFLLEKGEGLDDFGRPINALRTFSTMIINLLDMFPNSNMIVAFDENGLKTYRTNHSFYKAGRLKMPIELISQKKLISEMLKLYGIANISSSSLEADDIIGTLAKKFAKENIKVDIITSDKDLLQLVDENINVFISKTGVSKMNKFTIENFKDMFSGLNPEQVVDLKGIMGDSSDNLIGIRGIGEKGAIKLLHEFGSLEKVIKNKAMLSINLQNKIENGKEMGILCKKIATIITDGEVKMSFKQSIINDQDKEKLIIFLREYSVHNIANKLEKKWL